MQTYVKVLWSSSVSSIVWPFLFSLLLAHFCYWALLYKTLQKTQWHNRLKRTSSSSWIVCFLYCSLSIPFQSSVAQQTELPKWLRISWVCRAKSSITLSWSLRAVCFIWGQIALSNFLSAFTHLRVDQRLREYIHHSSNFAESKSMSSMYDRPGNTLSVPVTKKAASPFFTTCHPALIGHQILYRRYCFYMIWSAV